MLHEFVASSSFGIHLNRHFDLIFYYITETHIHVNQLVYHQYQNQILKIIPLTPTNCEANDCSFSTCIACNFATSFFRIVAQAH